MEITPLGEGSHVYAIGTNEDSERVIISFTRNTSTGALTFVTMDSDIPGLEGASSIEVSPDGNDLYITSHTENSLIWFSINSDGRLTWQWTYISDWFNYPRDTKISPDGKTVYVVSYYGDAIACFHRNPETGMLTYFYGISNDDYDTPGSVLVAPNSRHIYMTEFYGDSLSWFTRNW